MRTLEHIRRMRILTGRYPLGALVRVCSNRYAIPAGVGRDLRLEEENACIFWNSEHSAPFCKNLGARNGPVVNGAIRQ